MQGWSVLGITKQDMYAKKLLSVCFGRRKAMRLGRRELLIYVISMCHIVRYSDSIGKNYME